MSKHTPGPWHEVTHSMSGILALKRLQPSRLRYVGGTIDYKATAARDEWKHVLAFATALTRFELARDGSYTHVATVDVDGVDEPVSVQLRLT